MADGLVLLQWYQSHPYGMPPSKFAEAVLDDGEESNVILDGIPNFGKGATNQLSVLILS